MSLRGKPILTEEVKALVSKMSFDEQRAVIGIFLKSSGSGRLWDLLTGLRGPDSPSETPNMTSSESAAAYAGRRNRKFKTTEIIRDAAFFGVVGGAARYHTSSKITLPQESYWDHFDKHMARAAAAIGLKVEYED